MRLHYLFLLLSVLVALPVWAGDSGHEAVSSRTNDGYKYYRWANPENPSGVATQYAAGVPIAAAFDDTIFVARDLNFDSEIDSVGVGEYVDISSGFVSYIGTGPDTLWIKMLDDNGESIGLFRYVSGSAGVAAAQRLWPIISWGKRLVYFAGRSTAAADEWLIHTGHEVP